MQAQRSDRLAHYEREIALPPLGHRVALQLLTEPSVTQLLQLTY